MTPMDGDPHELPKIDRKRPYRGPRTPSTRPVTPRRNLRPQLPEGDQPVDYGVKDVVTLPDGVTAYQFRYKPQRGKPRYLIVENEYKDRGGIPGLLTYTAEAGNRITIEQELDNAGKKVARRGNDSKQDRSTFLKWHVIRFEARERAMGKESKFDSLRDSYPVAQIRRLGTANDASLTFERDPWTGVGQRIRIQPGRTIGPATRLKLSKTTKKCLLDRENVEALLDDIGPLILPRVPRKVGESWTRKRDKEIRNFGKSVTSYTLTLERVDENPEGSLIAHVSIKGDLTLVPDPMPTSSPASQPTSPVRGRQQKKRDQKRHDFKIDSERITGSYTFDITNGMLLDLTLRRDSSLSAEMESEKLGTMSLVNAENHTLRVKMQTDKPATPLIVGGPQPPKDDPADLVRPPPTKQRKTAASQNAERRAQQQRAQARDYAERRRQAREKLQKRREAALRRRGITSQPATSQPAWPPKPEPTTQPAPYVKPRPITTRPAPIIRRRPTTQPAVQKPAGDNK